MNNYEYDCNKCKYDKLSGKEFPCAECYCFNHYEEYVDITKVKDENYITKVANEIAELVERKNHDYGNSFDITINDYGKVAYFLRIDDKLNRLKQLMLSDKISQVDDEKIEDTLRDIIGYTLLMLNYENNH